MEDKRRLIINNTIELLLKKNAVYGSDNIVFTGYLGILVRLVDKGYRVCNIVANNPDNQYESLTDTLVDIVGYSIIGMMLLQNTWGKSGLSLQMQMQTMMDKFPTKDYVGNGMVSDYFITDKIRSGIVNAYSGAMSEEKPTVGQAMMVFYFLINDAIDLLIRIEEPAQTRIH